MSDFLKIRLYAKDTGYIGESEVEALISSVLMENGMLDEEGAPKDYKKKPIRTIDVTLDEGIVTIKSAGDLTFTATLDEQLSNEFVIQVEMQNIKRWNPMRYSDAYAADLDCAWELEYTGLHGACARLSGKGTYPKEWRPLMDIIEAFGNRNAKNRKGVYTAAKYYDELTGQSSAKAALMTAALSGMGMPEDVVAAGLLHLAAKEKGFSRDFVAENYDPAIIRLMIELGDVTAPGTEEPEPEDTPDDPRWETVKRVRASGSLYLKRVALADCLSDLIILSRENKDGVSDAKLGAYYAGMVTSLGDLEKDKASEREYREMVDLYKEVFVAYKIDSENGIIYQFQGDTASVALRRGEYEWKPCGLDSVPDQASPLSKDLALFIAGLWKREADEALVRDGNRNGKYDVPDMHVLKVAIHKAAETETKHSKNIAASVLLRMIKEGEQILTPMQAGIREKAMIESGNVQNVKGVPVSFLGIEEPGKDKTYAAVFTSMDEIGDIDGENVTGIPVKTVFRFVKEMGDLDGVIVDPFSDSFIVSKEKMSELLAEESRDADPAS